MAETQAARPVMLWKGFLAQMPGLTPPAPSPRRPWAAGCRFCIPLQDRGTERRERGGPHGSSDEVQSPGIACLHRGSAL